MILLTPGPCMTSETVRLAGALPDLNHRDPAFGELLHEVRENLANVYPAHHKAYVIGGSGTAAVEAMVTSGVDQGPVLVLENGYYSSRIAEILELHGIPHHRLSFDWLEPWDLGRIEEELKRSRFEAIVATHHETTTGRLNPVGKLTDLAEAQGARVLVDAMSSFGADDLPLSRLHAVCSSANKCLHGIPGVSFVLLSEELQELSRRVKPRSYYLHLSRYEGDSPPLTPPVPALAALRQALREFNLVGALRSRHAKYQRQASTIRTAATEVGLTLAVKPEDCSCTLSCLSLPDGWSSDRWLAENRRRGYMLYGCKGDLKERYFQASNMGEVTDAMIDSWIESSLRPLAGSG